MRARPDAILAAARAPRRVLAGLLLAVAATAAPTLAQAFTLTQLLQMPLERLLQLRIEAPR